MAYSYDFRKAALEYWEKGHSQEELYGAFGIYPSRIDDWKKLQRETGSLEPQYRETRKRKIDMNELTKAVERKPDATLAELAKIFDCTDVAVFYALERAKIPLKKTIQIRRTMSYRGNNISAEPSDIGADTWNNKLSICR